MQILEMVCRAMCLLGIFVQAVGVIVEACGNDNLGYNISIIGFTIFITGMLSLSTVYVIDNMKK